MVIKTDLFVREATKQDRSKINNLIHLEPYVHRHLDWKIPLDWLGKSPFLVAEENGRVIATLACPPDPPETAWVRVFATSAGLSPQHTWEILWAKARKQLAQFPVVRVASIAMNDWYRDLLTRHGFTQIQTIVLLIWDQCEFPAPKRPFRGSIRRMRAADLPAVHAIDHQAFRSIWRNSQSSLKIAFNQAVIATVAETETGAVGYQISTPSPFGGHLARLAVLPQHQNQGIGYALTCDLLEKFAKRGALRVTVNTQSDNHSSMAIYKKAGFKFSGEEYPVYQYEFK